MLDDVLSLRVSFWTAGACSLELSLPIVVTSSPWPEPETLRLAGVAGPNCELVLFKVIISCIEFVFVSRCRLYYRVDDDPRHVRHVRLLG